MTNNIQPPERPPEIDAALRALDMLSSEKELDELARLKKVLPALARKIVQTGEEASAEILVSHVRKGDAHLKALNEHYSTKKKSSLSYESIVEGFSTRAEAMILREKQQKTNALQFALQQHDLESIMSLLLCNTKEKALFDSAENGHTETVKLLLERGADIHADNDKALRWSALHGHTETVKLLLERGANIHARNDDALYYSAFRGHTETVKLLLDRGADIHAERASALRWSAKNGHTESVKLLLERGADIHARNDEPLRWSALQGHTEIVKLLLERGADIHADNDKALRWSAENGHTETVKLLLERGADIHANNDEALQWSAKNGHTESVKLLLERGADIHARNDEPLRFSALYGHTETVKLLLDRGADIHADNDEALRWSARNGHTETVKLLLERGADIHARNDETLRWSAENGHTGIVKLLLESGANISVINDQQRNDLKNYQLWHSYFPTLEGGHSSFYQLIPHHFNQGAYEALLPIIRREMDSKNTTTQIYAYHAACLFKSEQRVLEYLKRWGDAVKQPLHDVIQHIKIPQEGRPDLKAWGDAVLKHGPKMAKYVKFSHRLPEPIKDGSGGWSYSKTKEEIAQYVYQRGHENPSLASFCLDFAWDEDDFNDALKQIKKFNKKYYPSDFPEAANDNIKGGAIPDITIRGTAFDKEGYTFYKLPDGDVRGLLLGEFTNCCQHLANAGRECAKHGFRSEHGGFYVVEEGKSGDIIAQCWAWRGQKGELVFDSLESLSGRFNTEKWVSLCTVFSERVKQTVKSSGITGFYIGKGGSTPRNMPFQNAEHPAKPIDYSDYRDSSKQYQIASYE